MDIVKSISYRSGQCNYWQCKWRLTQNQSCDCGAAIFSGGISYSSQCLQGSTVVDFIRPCGSRSIILIVYHVIKTLLIFIYYEKDIDNRPFNINLLYFTSY